MSAAETSVVGALVPGAEVSVESADVSPVVVPLVEVSAEVSFPLPPFPQDAKAARDARMSIIDIIFFIFFSPLWMCFLFCEHS